MSSESPVVVRHLKNFNDFIVDQMVEVAQRAFTGDKFSDVLSGGDTSLAPLQLAAMIRAGLIGGEVYVAGIGEDISGFAVWFGPGQDLYDTEEQRSAGYNQFIEKCPVDLRDWWQKHFIPKMMELSEKSVGGSFHKDSWVLSLLVVDPIMHRKKVASMLISTVEALAVKDGLPLCLETTTEINVQIYKRMGFTLRGGTMLHSPIADTPMYVMTKP